MNQEELLKFRSHLRVLEREITRGLAEETTCCGVTLAQCHTLLELDGGQAQTTALAERLDLDKSSLSRTVDQLVKAGLVERRPSPQDRRAIPLALTELGQAKVNYIHALCNAQYSQVLSLIDPERIPGVLEAVGLLAEALQKARVTKTNACGCGPQEDHHE